MKSILFILCLSSILLVSFGNSQGELATFVPVSEKQQRAFKVLENKCNECHRKDKPSKTFTIANMNRFAKSINKQVFIKKKMPKGDEVTLTAAEVNTLKAWLAVELQN